MKTLLSIIFLSAALVCQGAGIIRVSPVNPRYVTDDNGQAILLTGWNTWNQTQLLPNLAPSDWETDIDEMVSQGNNYVRLWNWAASDLTYFACPAGGWGAVSPLPFQRTGPGNATDGGLKFDLTQYDETFFQNFSNKIAYAQSQGVTTSFMLFEAIVMEDAASWSQCMWNSANNINGFVAARTDLYRLSAATGSTMAAYTNYVAHCIDRLNGFDNFFWELQNEGPLYSTTFWAFILDFIQAYEKTKPKQHAILISGGYDVGTSATYNQWVIDTAMSRTNVLWAIGATTNQWVISTNYTTPFAPRILDTDHIFYPGKTDLGWLCKGFFAGYNLSLMDDAAVYPKCWDSTDPNNVNWGPIDLGARRLVGNLNQWSKRVDLLNMGPSPTTTDTGFCLMLTNKTDYLIYQDIPTSSVTVSNMVAGVYAYEWWLTQGASYLSSGVTNLSSGANTFTVPAGFYSGPGYYSGRILHVYATE